MRKTSHYAWRKAYIPPLYDGSFREFRLLQNRSKSIISQNMCNSFAVYERFQCDKTDAHFLCENYSFRWRGISQEVRSWKKWKASGSSEADVYGYCGIAWRTKRIHRLQRVIIDLTLRPCESIWQNIATVVQSALLLSALVLGRYTEIPNRYPIFWSTDTDTNVGIHNTEKYRISTIKYRKYRKSVRYLPPRTENFITERVHIICKLNLYIDVIYNLNIVDCLFRVLDVVLHCIRAVFES